MKSREPSDASLRPLLYYRSDQQITEYRNKPTEEKLTWLQAQMEFFHAAMPEKAKRIRERLKKGEI